MKCAVCPFAEDDAELVPRSKNATPRNPYHVRKERITTNCHSWHLWPADGYYYGEFEIRAAALKKAFELASEIRKRPAARRVETVLGVQWTYGKRWV